MKTVAVIMAGGKGERFWPVSRSNLPKQFLSLSDNGNTMIQLTVKRLLPLIPHDDIYVVTSKDYVGLAQQQLPEIPPENILAEPCARNTAPCVGYAAVAISQKHSDAVMLVLPSDHLIKFEELYIDTMSEAVNIANESGSLVTIGITPTYPETGYGYINFGKDGDYPKRGVYAVKRFVEKPDAETAKGYLTSGKYLWNSGMFAWKMSTILERFKALLPDIYRGLTQIRDAIGTEAYGQVLEDIYSSFKPVSIDYGIMEKTENIYTIPGNFGWDDVGSWLALGRINKTNEAGNIERGDVITIGTRDSIIWGGSKLVAAVGLSDIVIIDTHDAVLVCAKDATQDIKGVLEDLRTLNRSELI